MQAYTSQMVAITMMALALSEDSIARRSKRDAIIDGLGQLPDTIREVCPGKRMRALPQGCGVGTRQALLPVGD